MTSIRLSPPARTYLEALAGFLASRAFRSRSLGETVEYALYKLPPPQGAPPGVVEAHDALVEAMRWTTPEEPA